MGIVGAGIGIGFMLGIPIGGILAGDDPARANFVRPALVSVALSLTAILLVRLWLPESREREQRALSRSRGLTPLKLLLERPALRPIAAGALLVTSAQGILESIFVIWALGRFGAGPRTVSIALFCPALVAVLMQGGFVRVLAPRLGEPLLGGLGAATYALGLLVVAAAGTTVPAVAVGLVLCGLGMGAFSPSASALASRQSRPDDRGAVMGTYQASTSLARVIGPFVSGPLYSLVGANAPFVAGACISLPAAWLILRTRRRGHGAEASESA
jgi:MFS family permease